VGGGACVVLSVAQGCARRADRKSVLEAVVREVLVPNARRLIVETRALDAAIRALGPDSSSRERARSAFNQAIIAWKRASTFRSGPFEKSNAFLRAMFWPVRPAAIALLLRDARPMDERLVQELGADQKGLFGLEYALLEPGMAARIASADASGKRSRRYAREVSGNVLGYAERLGRLLGDGREYGAALALEIVAGTAELYGGAGGGGLSDLVRAIQAPLDARIHALFVEAEAQLRAPRCAPRTRLRARSLGVRSVDGGPEDARARAQARGGELARYHSRLRLGRRRLKELARDERCSRGRKAAALAAPSTARPALTKESTRKPRKKA
jgi:hypothetical protein